MAENIVINISTTCVSQSLAQPIAFECIYLCSLYTNLQNNVTGRGHKKKIFVSIPQLDVLFRMYPQQIAAVCRLGFLGGAFLDHLQVIFF